jgi:hypothetical protein
LVLAPLLRGRTFRTIVPDRQAADRFIEDARKQAEAVDANDILYSLKSSAHS